jgi:hypothetical protein
MNIDTQPECIPDGLTLTRRGACSLGLAITGGALGIGALGLGASCASATELPAMRYVVTDRRHVQSLEFSAVLIRQGVPPLEVTDGLTRLWREALLPLWQEKGGAVAGLTERGTWDCIAEQARSAMRRPILVAHHAVAEGGEAAAHLVSAPSAALRSARALDRCGRDWPRAMAQLAIRCTADGRLEAGEPYRSPALADPLPSLSLVSWIIA